MLLLLEEISEEGMDYTPETSELEAYFVSEGESYMELSPL